MPMAVEVLLYVFAAALILHEVQRAQSFPGGWRVYWTSSANVSVASSLQHAIVAVVVAPRGARP